MIRVVAFGNCQADALTTVLQMSLPSDRYDVTFISNNAKTGDLRPQDEILTLINKADVLIFQPLSELHGPLAEESVRNVASGASATFAMSYLFNSGVSGLCHAPAKRDRPYGMIFGEDSVVKRLRADASVDEIIEDYREGAIDFDLPRRFAKCLTELRRRDSSTEIKLAEFIGRHYRETKLFMTHNHPTTAVLVEICAQIKERSDLPLDLERLRRIENENIAKLPTRLAPISPHDAAALGYQFEPDPNWEEIGTRLITMIAGAYDRGAFDGKPRRSRSAVSG